MKARRLATDAADSAACSWRRWPPTGVLVVSTRVRASRHPDDARGDRRALKGALILIPIAFAETLAAGGALARTLCTFVALFVTLRLVVATCVFDMEPYLTNGIRRVGYRVLNLAFVYPPVVYALAAAKPLWLE